MGLLDGGKVLIINGYDFTPLLSEDGLVYTRNDVDSPEAGELADGTMRRDRVIIRPTLEVTIANEKVFIRDDLAHLVMKALEPQYVKVTYFDIRLGREETRLFYTNGVKCTLMNNKKGVRRWSISPFTLVAEGVAGDGRERPS